MKKPSRSILSRSRLAPSGTAAPGTYAPGIAAPGIAGRRRCSRALLALVAVTLGVVSLGSCAGLIDSGPSDVTAKPLRGWLQWRGPEQAGVSRETNLPDTWEIGGENHLWDIDLQGRGTPLIAEGRVYSWGYRGETFDLYEVLVCLDESTGEVIWERKFSDYLSDTIYNRYTIGSPVIDAETRTIFLMASSGEIFCMSLDGDVLWSHSMMEEFGRNTYPNGRTGAPTIEGDLVVFRGVTNNWGRHMPPRDRLYAFDKRTGEPVWNATAGLGPPYLKDSCFSTPVYDWWEGRRVLYTGLGSGALVCVNAGSGEPIWRSQQIIGGINSSVLLHDGKLLAVHGRQNLDNTETGRMLALALPDVERYEAAEELPFAVGKGDDELWRLPISMFTSSPVLVGDRLYQVDHTGDLHCVDVTTGTDLWHKKLGPQQIHASPLYADGKLYVPLNEGEFWILRPSDTGAEELCFLELEGNGLGSPAAWNGKVYVHTTKRLYCFGSKKSNAANLPAPLPPVTYPEPGKPASLQLVPNEVLLRQGESVAMRVYELDASGQRIGIADGAVDWQPSGPLTADVSVDGERTMTAAADATPSVGEMQATLGSLTGGCRARVVPKLPFRETFDSIALTKKNPTDGADYGDPPAYWILGRVKWEIRERDGSKVLAKSTEKLIDHKVISFIGHPDESNYTMSADVMTDGGRRGVGEVGLVNQRYLIKLFGNEDVIEVSSNIERFQVQAPFDVKAKTWYRMVTQVDVAADGSGVVRAKVWPRDAAEPAEWTIEAKHDMAHRRGAPGIFGFSPQPRFRVYVDNIEVTPRETEGSGS